MHANTHTYVCISPPSTPTNKLINKTLKQQQRQNVGAYFYFYFFNRKGYISLAHRNLEGGGEFTFEITLLQSCFWIYKSMHIA